MKLLYRHINRGNETYTVYAETAEEIQSELNIIYGDPSKIQGLKMCNCTQNGNFGCQGKAAICECECHRLMR